MGKGDQRTKRGKRMRGSFGKTRPKVTAALRKKLAKKAKKQKAIQK